MRWMGAMLLAPVLAACQGGDGPPPGAAYDRFDVDRDGKITQAEFSAAFALLDVDGDGRIDAEESPAVVYEADADRDGVVAADEFRAIAVSRLEADADRDGVITRAEFVAYDRATVGALRGLGIGRQPTAADRRAESRWVLFRF